VLFRRLRPAARLVQLLAGDNSQLDPQLADVAELRGGDVVALPGATLRVSDGWRGAPHPGGGWLLERIAR